MPPRPDLHAVPTIAAPSSTIEDRAAALDLRDAIAATRGRLLDVLHARARSLHGVATWVGPHRHRYDQDALELLAAGRDLDASLAELLHTLDAEITESDRP